MLSIFIAYPELALIPAFTLFGLYAWRRSRAALLVTVIWLLYAVYEYLMRERVLCSGECNIRVDLLLIYPVLAIATIAAIWQSNRRSRSSDIGGDSNN